MAKRCRNDTTAEDPKNQRSKKRLRGGGEICSRSDLCGGGEITTIEEDKAYLVGLASEIEEKNSQLKAAQQVLEDERQDLRQQRDLFEARWQLLDDERAAQDILLGVELKRCNHQQDLLSKERQDLKLEREIFERQWDLLDAKRDETAQDLTRMADRKDALSAHCATLSRRRDTLAADCASLQNQMRVAQDSAQKALQHLHFCEHFNQVAQGFKDRAALLDQASLRFIQRLDNVFLHPSIPIFIPIPVSNSMDLVDSFNKLFANTITTQTTLHTLALQLRKKTDDVKLEQLQLHKELKSLCNLTTTTSTTSATDPSPAPATDPTTGGEECAAAAADDEEQHAQHSLEYSEFKNLLKECNHLHQLLSKERHAVTMVKDNFQRRWQLLHAHAPPDHSTLPRMAQRV